MSVGSFTSVFGLCLIWTLTCILLPLGVIQVSADTTIWYGMDSMCGDTINMADYQIYNATVVINSVYRTDNCTLSIKSNGWHNWNKLSFQITDQGNTDQSCIAFKQMFGQSTKLHEISGLPGEYCLLQPPLHRQFTVESLHISLIADESYRDRDMYFEVVITVYRDDGLCDAHECDNNRCIPNGLKCTDYNPCGDGSDCPAGGLSPDKVFGIVIGAIAGVVLCVYVCKYCVMAMNCTDDDEAESPQSEDERTPGIHYNDWQPSVHNNDWRTDSDESIELQPFHTSDSRIRVPSYETRDQCSGARLVPSPETMDRNVPSHNRRCRSNIPPADLPPTIIPSAPSMPDVTHTVLGEIDTAVQSNATNTGDIAMNETDTEALPPSYEYVIAHENDYKASRNDYKASRNSPDN